MNCPRTSPDVDAYLDGELSVTESLSFEKHLDGCEPCRAALHSHSRLRQALSTSGLYHHAPAELVDRIDALISPGSKDLERQRPLPAAPQRTWRMVGIIGTTAAAMAACVTIAVVGFQSRGSADRLLAQEIVASHVRSMMADHLLDVPSTDRHTVKPWFDGKLDFAPPVRDTAAQGFPLVGGRLDYIDDRPVAALVYKRQQHIINLFIWTSGPAPEEGNHLLTRQGYNLVRWTHAGMTFWAISDVELTQLQQFAEVVQTAQLMSSVKG